jgi:hypothetical protein
MSPNGRGSVQLKHQGWRCQGDVVARNPTARLGRVAAAGKVMASSVRAMGGDLPVDVEVSSRPLWVYW